MIFPILANMPSRRDLIKMSDEEINEFLKGRHTMGIATILPNGWPHLVAMFYGFFPDNSLGIWTYAKSQKVKNLERDPKISAIVETGESYSEIKGVSMLAEGEILTDKDSVLHIGRSLFERYFQYDKEGVPAEVEYMARKRVAIKIKPIKIISWDHSKLGGTY
jgi:general stress protein 26